MLEITRRLRVPETEFQWSFVRSGGPGGQNVNKVASKAVLRWNVPASPSLPEDVKARLLGRLRSRLTAEGDLLLTSQRYRDRERNRQDCLAKLRHLVVEAAAPPKPRKPSRPTRASRGRRLQEKRRRSQAKAARKRPLDS